MDMSTNYKLNTIPAMVEQNGKINYYSRGMDLALNGSLNVDRGSSEMKTNIKYFNFYSGIVSIEMTGSYIS